MPFFQSEARNKAKAFLLILLTLLFLVNGINVYLSYVGRDFISALSRRDMASFYALLWSYLGLFALATVVSVSYRYTEERLGLIWREWMTQHLLKRYLFGRNYYKLRSRHEIDNPDQRIAEDIKNFTSTSLSLFLIGLNSIVTLLAFIGVLLSISSQLVIALVIYAFVGTTVTVLFGRKLVRLHYRQYNREANFRYSVIRIRDNAESIAFYRGEARERIQSSHRFVAVVQNTLALIGWNRNLGFLTTGYNYIALIVPTIIVAPFYLRSEVEFGVVTQAAGAFSQVLAALSVIIIQFERISAYAAGIVRLSGLWDAVLAKELGEEDDDPKITVIEGEILVLKDVQVSPPNSEQVLVRGLSFSLPVGESILIQGESGSGKSSILRTIAGLWNSGQGSITRPQLRDMMFLPQRPYMPLGSLRAQLMYPGRESPGSDDGLRLILQAVNLEKIADRTQGSLDRQIDWANVLSLGEQQRIAVARVLFRKPKLIFFDEATSALDEENEARVYALIKKMGVSYISVGHRSTLRQFHHSVMTLEGNGKWRMERT